MGSCDLEEGHSLDCDIWESRRRGRHVERGIECVFFILALSSHPDLSSQWSTCARCPTFSEKLVLSASTEQATTCARFEVTIRELNPCARGNGADCSLRRSNTTLFNLYFLDSGSYIKTISPWGKDYDYIKPSQ